MSSLAVISKPMGSNPLAMRCGPHCHASKISGEILQDEFHEMFRASVQNESGKKKLDKKKTKKKKSKDKARAKVHSENTENALQQMPFLEIRSNPSLFAVFACVRQCVLDKQIRESAQLFIRTSSSRISDSESDEEEDKSRDLMVKVPKIVGIGLCSVFELIRESRKKHPALCTRSLQALLDMLQGQQPEGLKNEPTDVIDTLFDLLLDIASGQHSAATSSSSSSSEYAYSTSATSLTSYACACLLSLVIARGDTGKLLSAASAMLMSPVPLVNEEIPTPGILTSLQRSAHAVLLGKTHRPDWLSHGIPKSSLCDTFKVQIPKCKPSACISSSIVCDGKHLFILSGNTIYKIGSGYAGTVKGQIVTCRGGLKTEDKGWLGYAKGFLYFQPHSLISTELVKIDPDTLKEIEPVQLDAPDCGPSACFSDGEYLGLITAGKDVRLGQSTQDSFVIRTFKSVITPMPCIHELTLKLARKCMDVFGSGVFDEELTFHSVTLPLNEDEPMSIACGKDFAVLRTMTGKVMFAGKSQSLGVKQSNRANSKWTELPVTKSPKIVHFSVGHEGQHALLLSEDGSAFFAGLARRGEDGDQTKGRRQPKPVKPKKMIKMEGHRIVYSACNNGTSALVTLEGGLYLFGKDTAHTDHNSGLVTDLKDIIVTQVALGKAHVVVLTNKGLVWTFGINHKGQCGRDYSHSTTMKEVALPIAMATAPEEEGEDEELEAEEDVICAPGKHNWKHDQCMVCTLCGECTGYGAGCIASGRPDRNPGLPCGCGAGDSGCAECGCCRMCSRENDQEVELADWSQLAAGGGGVLDNKQSDVIVFDIHYGGRGVARLEDRIRRRMEEYRMIRQRRKQMLQSLKVTLKSQSPSRSIPKDNQDKASVASADDTAGSDHEKETTKLTSLPPGQLFLPFEIPITQIACGMHHTVLLIENGEVYTFGSNQHGQLGLGDFIVRGSPCLVKLPATVTQVAAGSSHTVILTNQGQVYTFGSYQRGQLGRSPLPTVSEETSRKERGKDSTWHAIPGLVPKVGGRNGRRATWVGASGDQTFIKIDESLINSHNLTRANVIANRQCVGIIPNQIDQVSPFRCVMINKVDGTCRSFNSVDQAELNEYATCLDSVYNIVWGYNPSTQEINRFNIISSEMRSSSDSTSNQSYNLPNMLSPELSVPCNVGSSLTRSHAALHLLGCLDLLTTANERGLIIQNEEEEKTSVNKVYSKEDFSVVNRFESHGGGWGYSGHSIEAIRFMADTDILLGGFGLFGGRGEYTAKIKLLDIGPEGGDQETDGELLAETEEIPYECGPRQKFPVLFDEPVPLQANRWYVTWSRISGPSSDCGSSGQSVVTTEDQVVFFFKSSNKSNNGTDVNAGQLPQLLYRVITPDNLSSMKPSNQMEPVCILGREFSRKVTPDCFHSLLKLLRWSWQTFKASLGEMSQAGATPHTPAVLDLERLMYISISSLHLLRIYINEIYPNGPISRKNHSESPKLADCIGDARVLLRHILSDQIPQTPIPTRYQNGTAAGSLSSTNVTPPILNRMFSTVLEECQQTFLTCYHAFYPNSALKWKGLCDLLLTVDVPWARDASEGDHLLAAVLASLCSPTLRLTSILPISMETESSLPSETTLRSPLEPNQDGIPLSRTTSGQEMGQSLDNHRYPILVETMTQRTEREGCHSGPYSFKAVLDHLLAAVVRPVRAQLRQEPLTHSAKLVASTCALLATIIAELSSQTIGTVLDIQGVGGQILHVTPSRFARVSQNRTWNTGNGSPDAICFSVDRPGILIKGVTIFGGGGNERHYELELLDDQSTSNNDPSHTQRWKTLEIVRGSFGPDDCYGEVAEITFQRNIPIKENVKYALRLRNHGDRTNNGDGGLAQVKGPDGTMFTFSDCSLSFNGTNHTRGQISQILYYSTPQDTEIQQSYRDLAELQARRNALSICSTVVRAAAEILMEAQAEEDIEILGTVGSSHLVTMLLPLALAHMGPLATSDPKSAVQVLNMVRDLLPLVAALNKRGLKSFPYNRIEEIASSNTTSQHYALAESDHPYRPATVSNYRVTFPSNVRWMALEFDSQCGTAQAEDSLQLYIPAVGSHQTYTFPKVVSVTVSSSTVLQSAQGGAAVASATPEDEDDFTPYWPVLRKFSGSIDWPHSAIILPGNEVVFSLETASDYVKDEKATFYGFRCQVVGFECPQLGNNLIKQNQNIADVPPQLGWEGLAHLERELAYLGGMCAASLMRKDLLLPPESVNEVDEDLEVIEDLAQQVYNAHSQLLCKGFALAHPPSVQQALEGTLPFSSQSNERPFLKDFVACTAGTSGGRLARWLQPEPYVDPKQCELHCSQDELKCGWPAVITVVTKDQYGKVVYSPLLKVEVKAVPLTAYDKDGDANRKLMKVSKPDTGSMTCFGGHPPPNLDTAYEITVKDKMFYYAITMMKPYENYSFEELRYVSPTKKRLIENMLVRSNNDGTYVANWTPGSVGWYLLRASIDGFEMGGSQLRSVEVKEPPQGLILPSKAVSQKSSHQPSKLRKFVVRYSAGLRVRSHPSLQSEQIGVVPVNGTISFVDELHNDDGVWVRLSLETVKKFCHNGYIEAWCLQYNQHLGKTLLVPVEEPKSVLAEFFRDVGHFIKKKPSVEDGKDHRPFHKRGPGTYHVVMCGASGHNIRSRPSLKSPPVGMLVLGNSIGVMEDAVNADGSWVRLDKETMQRYCFNADGEAWSLAQSRSDVVYLQHEAEMMQAGDSDDDQSGSSVLPICNNRGTHENGVGFSVSGGVNSAFSAPNVTVRKGYDFGTVGAPVVPPVFGQSPGQSAPMFTFGSGTSDQEGGSSGTTSPFIFGSPASTPSTSMNTIAESEKTETDKSEKDSLSSSGGRVAALQKWLREESSTKNMDYCRSSLSRDIPAELSGVSVKELVKAIGESRFNGNAATPPQTPPSTPHTPRKSRSISPKPTTASDANRVRTISLQEGSGSRLGSASSSPVPVPARHMSIGPTCATHYESPTNSSVALSGSPKGYSPSPRHRLADGWSPIHIPSAATPKGSVSGNSSVRRNSLQSDTSVGSHFSSILRELSQTSATGCIGCITQRNTISPISTPGTPGTPATPGTPKKEVTSVCSTKQVTQTGTQTSPDNAKGHFNIGTGGAKEEPLRLSPKMARKDRASRQLRNKRDRSHSPHHHHHHHHHHAGTGTGTGHPAPERSTSQPSKEKVPKEPVKEAMSPSVAECLRAVFAAFLWHEGLVYDAMACASFLKFNPNVPKNQARIPQKPVVMREKSGSALSMTREQRARLRHSVEVTPGLMNLHPSTIEQIWCAPLNANIIQNKAKKTVSIREEHLADGSPAKIAPKSTVTIIDAEDGVLTCTSTQTSIPSLKQDTKQDSRAKVEETKSTLTQDKNEQLPQSLQYIVYLWEQISAACLKVIVQQLILPSPANGTRVFHRLDKDKNERDKDRKLKKRKDYRQVAASRSHLFGEASGVAACPERETVCELCGHFFAHPVTYHMRQAHPGCGDQAGGKGYNSSGNYCGGWAGNCGDGGIGGSSWYLVCDACREKYTRQKRQNMLRERAKKSRKKGGSAVSRLLSPLPPTEAHQVMKNNALFLLELSSATRSGLPSNKPTNPGEANASVALRRSIFGMPSLLEQGDMLENNPFPVGPFQCLDALGVQQEYNNIIGQEYLSEEDIRVLQNGGEASNMAASVDSTMGLGNGILRSMTLNGDSNNSPPPNGKVERRKPRMNRDSGSFSGTRSFHRSISVGLTSKEWNKQDGEGLMEGRVIMMRKRNSSGSEEPSSSFLCQPSSVLTKLVNMAMEKPVLDFPLQRPVMIFMLQHHDLDRLQLAMKQALRKAACRVYGMQALNWLIRSVTQPISLHDLLWCFVAALAPSSLDRREEENDPSLDDDNKEKKPDQESFSESQFQDPDLTVCEHPLSEITIAGESVSPLPQTFHSLLQTISDLMMLLPVGSALQQMAMKCWCLKFLPEDHPFLHQSHVFSNISKILSRSEEEGEDFGFASDNDKVVLSVDALKDLTSTAEIKASSRQAMVSSLTDNSTETFWESGDDDRNKSKILTITCGPQAKPKVAYIHIDNCRDLGNKVSSVIFRSGVSAEEMQKLKHVDVENRFTGWLSCFIPDSRHGTIKLEMKGPDNTLRSRQVRILGQFDSEPLSVGKIASAGRIQQKNCEAETLKVFRLLTSQVFGKLILGENESDVANKKEDVSAGVGDRPTSGAAIVSDMETSNDLKEHMVGILFSRSKLTHLQKQVCAHIVAAIRKEAIRVRDEWETLLCSKNVGEVPKSSDAYCFEMLSMVLALSGSSVGRAYLAQQAGLLKDLFSLLHTGSARVQRQVTSLLRRVLPDVTPQMLASILVVPALPPTDFSIHAGISQGASTTATSAPSTSSANSISLSQNFDLHKMGILDVFLACIAKALTVQTKVKGGATNLGKGVTTVTLATSIHPRDYIGARWWLRGCMVRKLAEVIIQLLKDMAAGKLSEAWAIVTKGAIAENILNLTKMDENLRSPSECLRTPTLWLALASLCVLDQDHVERLSSGQWVGSVDQASPRPTCDNHDDGETLAIILCNECGNLCADCDRFLHLHRKTRLHQRQVFKEEEEAIRVDLHEGCGRTKLFWVMALADSKTLKAMVEFREGTRSKTTTTSGVCRFCGATGSSGLLAIGNVCGEPECQEHARNACTKMLNCGHSCGGIRTESSCLPCLHGCGGVTLKQDADDMCMICFTEALACAPAILLNCGHVFHLHCCRTVLQKRWSGPRITFGFSLCPICKAPMEHPVLKDLLDSISVLYDDVKRKALMRLEYEGLLKSEAVATPGARFYKDPAGFAMERYAYYVCFKCKKAYYGGEARCDIDAGPGEEYDPTELVCGACSDVSRAQMCPKHGTDFLEYKCRYCCSVAVFFCFGTTHFCNACHEDFQRVTNLPKQELPHCPAGPKAKQLETEECPLHVKHPPTGEEFALGCGVCRNAHTF